MPDPKSGTIEVDSKVMLSEVLAHMKRQNDHQVSQLDRGEAIIGQLRSTNRRINVLVGAAILLLGLGAVHQQKIDKIVNEQQAAQVRSVSLEKSVDTKISSGTADVVKKVEELGQTSPRVVTGSDGTLSLSVPVTIDTSAPPSPPPSKPAERLVGGRAAAPRSAQPSMGRRSVIKGLSGEQDHVLLPLE